MVKKPEGLVLGFDFGTKRIGVAVGQTTTGTATALTTIHANNGAPNWEEVAAIIREWQPCALVVGAPLNMDGTEQDITQAAQRFANRLHGRFNLPVFHADERLTSIEARQQVYASGGYRALEDTEIDSVAAQLILESWLREGYTKAC